MIPTTHLALFLVASLALIVTPGPDMIYVITRGVTQGRKAGLVSACGVCSGLIVHTTLAALGLSALLLSSTLAFAIVKYIGAAYLLFLGIKMLRSKEHLLVQKTMQQANLPSIFRQGFASNVLNPKIALFFLAFLPQFVSPFDNNVGLQMLFLGVVFMLLGLVFLSLVAYGSGRIGDWLRHQERLADVLRWMSGCIFIGLGIRLALTER